MISLSRRYSGVYNDDPATYGTSMLDSGSAWFPDSPTLGMWMQMDLQKERKIAGIVTQDRQWPGQYVKTFTVKACAQASLNGRACLSWVDVDNGAIFNGPDSGCSPAVVSTNCLYAGTVCWNAVAYCNSLTSPPIHHKQTALFASFVMTRFIRIYPLTWYVARDRLEIGSRSALHASAHNDALPSPQVWLPVDARGRFGPLPRRAFPAGAARAAADALISAAPDPVRAHFSTAQLSRRAPPLIASDYQSGRSLYRSAQGELQRLVSRVPLCTSDDL
jgi:hypothetical protein